MFFNKKISFTIHAAKYSPFINTFLKKIKEKKTKSQEEYYY